MKSDLKIAVENLMGNSGNKFGKGQGFDVEEWNSLNSKIGQKIPVWLIELFTEYSLSHAILGIEDREDKEMKYVLEFVSPEWMKDESIEPG